MAARTTLALLLAALMLGACGNETVPAGDPQSSLGRELRGSRAPWGVIVGSERKAHWLVQAVANAKPLQDSDWPARVELAPDRPVCRFSKPEDGEKLVNVHVGRGRERGPVFAFSDADLAKRTKKWIDVYQRDGKSRAFTDTGGDNLRPVDVVVTDTSGPLYLVLQNEWSGVLWNIQAAEGVQIARVAVISSGRAGIANLEGPVPVEFMGAGTLKSCKVIPARMPAEHWGFVRNAKAAGGSMDDVLQKNIRMARDYDKWFFAQFGRGAEDDVIGMQEISAVLIGDMPADMADRPRWKSLRGAHVRMTQADHVVASGRVKYREKHEELVVALATEMAGGDLQALRTH